MSSVASASILSAFGKQLPRRSHCSLGELCQQLLSFICTQLHWHRAEIWFDNSTGEFECRESWAPSEHEGERRSDGLRLKLKDHFKTETLFFQNLNQESVFSNWAGTFACALSAPLAAGRGVLLLYRSQERAPSPIELETIRALIELAQPHLPFSKPLAQRFHFQYWMGSSLGVETYLGRDRHTDRKVLIKMVSTQFSEASASLQAQSSLLSYLSLNYLTPVASGNDERCQWLVLPYTEGIPLRQYMNSRTLGAAETLKLCIALSRQLESIHSLEVTHGDIKPDNIIIPDNDVSGARLVDFGGAEFYNKLRLELDLNQTATIRYASPEQLGMMDSNVDGRSDLFSLGLVAYECLTQTLPFTGSTISELLRERVERQPPDIREFRPHLPSLLNDFIQRLVQISPEARYQRAAAVLHDANKILALLEEGQRLDFALGQTDSRAILCDPTFVARETELSTIEDLVRNLRVEAQGGVVALEGLSGGGKTRLLEELKRRLSRLTDLGVVVGQGATQRATRPFEILRNAEAFLRSRLREERQTIVFREKLGPHALALSSIFPELGAQLGVRTDTPIGPDEFSEVRSIHAISSLLSALGTRKSQVVLVLDDAQWMDELSLRAIHHWSQFGNTQSLLIILSFRSEEVPTTSALRRIPLISSVALRPLRLEEVARFCQSMAGSVPFEISELVYSMSEGNPFMVAACFRGLFEQDIIKHSPLGWALTKTEKFVASKRSAVVLMDRMNLLDTSCLNLLRIASVLGKEFRLDLLCDVSGATLDEAIKALQRAMERRLVRLLPLEGVGVFVHDKIREALLGDLSEEDARLFHEQAAESVLRRSPESVFDLAFHFYRSGDPKRALPFALEGARQAREQHSLPVAEEQLRIAEKATVAERDGQRHQVLVELAEILILRGLYEEAERYALKAKELATDKRSLLVIYRMLGDLYFKQSRVFLAMEQLQGGLRLLRVRVPSSKAGFIVAALRQAAIQLGHMFMAGLPFSRQRPPITEEAAFKAQLLSRLTYAYWFVYGKNACAWSHLLEINTVERFADSKELGQAYSEHAPVMTLIPLYRRGLEYALRGLRIRKKLRDLWGCGQSMSFIGVLHYATGRFDLCEKYCRKAIDIMTKTGDQWEIHTARWHIAYCLYRKGELMKARVAATDVLEAALELKDYHGAGIALAVLAKASRGHVAPRYQARIAEMLERQSGELHTMGELLQAQALCELAKNNPATAIRILEKARDIVAPGIQEYTVQIFPWLATAWRQYLHQNAARTVPREYIRNAESDLKTFLRVSREALRRARAYPNNLAHALREYGYALALNGELDKARATLQRSIDTARARGLRAEWAYSTLALHELGVEAGWEVDTANRHEARAFLDLHSASDPPLPSQRSVALHEQQRALVEHGKTMCACASKIEVFEALGACISGVFRSTHWTIFEVKERGRIQVFGQSQADFFSPAAAKNAVSSGKSVPLFDANHRNLTDTMMLKGIRSALYTPIFVSGKAVAGFCVSNTQVGKLYTSSEVNLADFIASIAEVALMNVHALDELKSKNQTLEKQVNELSATRQSLLEAKVEAEVANNAKTNFLAMVSHELRTPLAAILGYAELVELSNPDSATLSHINRIQNNGQHLLKLISDVIDIARVESGRVEMRNETVRISSLIQSARDTIGPLADRKFLQLTIRTAPDVPANAVTDSRRLIQALTNVLGNAVKFTPERGSVELSVDVEGEDLCFRVRDSGIGIPTEERARIFEPFAQVKTSEDTMPEHGGSGLGLAIARKIMRALGGDLILEESEYGRGSTFLLSLRQEGLHLTRDTPSGDRLSVSGTVGLSGRRLLLAEDTEDLRELYRVQLERYGARVHTVKNGQEAYEAAVGGEFDVILMDVRMPVMDGTEATRRIRRAGIRTPIVALSAHAMPESTQSCLEAGCNGYLTKPLRGEQLLETLTRLTI